MVGERGAKERERGEGARDEGTFSFGKWKKQSFFLGEVERKEGPSEGGDGHDGGADSHCRSPSECGAGIVGMGGGSNRSADNLFTVSFTAAVIC